MSCLISSDRLFSRITKSVQDPLLRQKAFNYIELDGDGSVTQSESSFNRVGTICHQPCNPSPKLSETMESLFDKPQNRGGENLSS